MNPELQAALNAGDGVLDARQHPALRRIVRRAVEKGHLALLLPGVYVATGTTPTPRLKALAVAAADPDAVVTGLAAAHLHGWPEFDAPGLVTAASPRLHDRPGFAFERRRIPRSLTRRLDGMRLTSRALTVVDLLPDEGGRLIDDALRRRVTLPQLWRALAQTPNRPGNAARRRLLADSRDQAWSAAERCAHAALRKAGVAGWVANYRVGVAQDADVFVDIAVRSVRLAIEIDGREFHEQWAAAARDRRRDRALALLGWSVVRFTAGDVLADPGGFAHQVSQLIAARTRQLA